ncbi:MAG: hypothetical protein K5908_01060, partial [Erysipelotrichaceae bacterium]|nr:hypothetical protein [Erysipelotrichaceae bacterium]
SGALDDWMFETQGIPAYTMEFWDLASKAGVPVKWGEKRDDPEEGLKRFAAVLKWVKENAPKYFMSWKKIKHPDFGEAEIGGFNYKFTHQNPPEHLLINELENDTKFNIRFIKAMPKLVIDSLKCEKISEDVYRIETIVGNQGYLSTSLTDTAVINDYAKPVKVTLEGAEIVSGKKETEIKELQGYSKTQTGVYYYGNISTDQNASARKKLSWIIKAKPGDVITIQAKQPKAGCVSKTITI